MRRNVSEGREARLQELLREGPEFGAIALIPLRVQSILNRPKQALAPLRDLQR